MDIKIKGDKKQKTNIETNDLVVISRDEEYRCYGVVVEQDEGYNVVILDDTDVVSWHENLYLNHSNYITHKELHDMYTLAKKSSDYKLTIEL